MRRGVWVKTFACGAVLLLALGLAGCWNPFSPDDGGNGDPKRDRKSPDRLLEFFATVYEDKNQVGYEESLDDDYTFTFMPADYDSAGVSAEEPYWGRTEDIERTHAMFAAADVKKIVMDLGTKVTPTWIDVTEVINVGGTPTLVDGFYCRIRPLIDVTIEGAGGEEPVIKQVRNSHIDVTVIPDRHNAGLWTILKIIESPIVE
jgi:hypothetical protein